jgi:dual specificity tyrosine-phosphorylation-regulated kinase 2/3/4
VTRGIAEGLEELRENRIIHCDLKPENVLYTDSDQLQIRLIDFGSAVFESSPMYIYIQSRFYRAPEILLGADYSYPIDMWSLGCMVAEMSTGRPLFPGESERDQMMWIVAALGQPGEEVVKRGKKARACFGESGEWLEFTNTKGKRREPGSLPLSRLLPNADPSLFSFISDCLKWEPEARLTPSQALQHPFLHPSDLELC